MGECYALKYFKNFKLPRLGYLDLRATLNCTVCKGDSYATEPDQTEVTEMT